MPKIPVDGIAQASKWDVLNLNCDRAGLDLRKVKNIVNQVQEVRSRLYRV